MRHEKMMAHREHRCAPINEVRNTRIGMYRRISLSPPIVDHQNSFVETPAFRHGGHLTCSCRPLSLKETTYSLGTVVGAALAAGPIHTVWIFTNSRIPNEDSSRP